jgi:hypothetical protein
MYKKVLTTTLVVGSLLFSGCGEESTSCRMDVQNNIDTANFDAAIDALNGACSTAYTPSDRYYNLASAYMGKSGFGAIDVVNILLDADDESGDSFSTFTKSIDENKNEESLEFLNLAESYYLRSISPDKNVSTLSAELCSSSKMLNDSRMVNACFYIGFNQTIQATTAITYLTKDIDSLVNSISNSDGTTPIDMKVSLDALAWSIGKSDLPNNSTVTSTAVTINGVEYTHLEVVQNGETFYRLADSNAPSATSSTLLTDGYCLSDGDKSACDGLESEDGSIDTTHKNASSCYACPLSFSGATPAISTLLVDTLNSGTDTLFGVTDDEDIQSSVNDFIKDITGDQDANVENSTITVENILDYLNK